MSALASFSVSICADSSLSHGRVRETGWLGTKAQTEEGTHGYCQKVYAVLPLGAQLGTGGIIRAVYAGGLITVGGWKLIHIKAGVLVWQQDDDYRLSHLIGFDQKDKIAL